MIAAELLLENKMFKARLAESAAELRKFKATATTTGSGLSTAIFGGGQFGGGLAGAMGLGGISSGLLKAGLPALLGTTALSTVKSMTSSMHDIELLADKLGESAEDIQRVSAVAKTTHTDIDSLATTFLRLEKTMGDPGSEKAAAAFANLGLSASKLAAMTLPEKVIALTEAFQQARRTGTGVADISDLIGKGFQNLLPILTRSSSELREIMEGVSPFAAKEVAEMAKLDEKLDQVTRKLAKFGKKILLPVGEFVLRGMDALSGKDPVEEARKREKEIDEKEKQKAEDKKTAAESLAQKETGLGGSGMTHVAGETTRALSLLTGHGGNDLVADATRNNGRMIETSNQHLQAIRQNTATRGSGGTADDRAPIAGAGGDLGHVYW